MQGLYLGFGKLRHLGDIYELGAIWEGRTLNETLYIDTRNPYHVVSDGGQLSIAVSQLFVLPLH